MQENTQQAKDRLRAARCCTADKCLHCSFTKAMPQSEGFFEEWVYDTREPFIDETMLWCRKHSAWVSKYWICVDYSMNWSLVVGR